MMPQQSLSSVPTLCSSTATALEGIWSEVGYSTAEKSAQIGALIDTIKNFCDMKVAEEKAVKNQFLVSIDQTRIEVRMGGRGANRRHAPYPLTTL